MISPSSSMLTIDQFLPMVGYHFLADCDPAPVEIKLLDASPLKDRGTDGRAPFILIFHTPPETLLVAGGYLMRCGKFGPEQIFINDMIPPLNAEAGYYYQAVFN
jgi:hypothetical protein